MSVIQKTIIANNKDNMSSEKNFMIYFLEKENWNVDSVCPPEDFF